MNANEGENKNEISIEVCVTDILRSSMAGLGLAEVAINGRNER